MQNISGHDVTKGPNVTIGQNFLIFMGKMDVKFVKIKCNHGTKCHTVGLAKKCSGRNVFLKKVFKTESSGVDEQSVHLEIKCHSERSED